MLNEHSPVLFSSAFAPSALQNASAFEVDWKGERKEGGREGGEKNESLVYLALRQTRQLLPCILNK